MAGYEIYIIGVAVYYALAFSVFGVPIVAMLGKTGLNPSWVLLLLLPVVGVWLCFAILAFARWPAQTPASGVRA